ncbi:MAG: sulfatase-like hydrolase/transferase [Candidatus Riflebacteria bacterium]|nr:sulfatase-like hydrolase/transferase [Candidatus Riflebacteria bacterium]
MTNAIKIQIIAIIILCAGIIWQIYPLPEFNLFHNFAPEHIFIAAALAIYIFSEKRDCFKIFNLYLSLISSVMAIIYIYKGHNMINWLVICSVFCTALLLSIQELLISATPKRLVKIPKVIFYTINLLIIIWLYADRIFLTTTKIHISLGQLIYMPQVSKEFFNALSFRDTSIFRFIFDLLMLTLVPLVFAIKRKPKILNNTVHMLKTGLIVLLCLIINLIHFNYFCTGLSLAEYISIRITTASLPLPPHPALSESSSIKALLNQPFKIDIEKCYSQPQIQLTKESLPKKIVYIIIESIKRDYFKQYMPRTATYCKRGLEFGNHHSVSNGTLSAMHSIFNGSFPINVLLQPPEKLGLVLPDFLKNFGYKSYLITPNFNMPTSSSWNKHIKVGELSEAHSLTNAVLSATESLLNSDEKQIICSYLYNTHFNYFYPKNEEKYLPTIDEKTNLFLMHFTQENLIGLRNRYINALLHADKALSNFFNKLENQKIFNDCLFVFVTDHGESLGEAGFIAHVTGPHVAQYKIMAYAFGRGIKPEHIASATTHADLLPVIGNKIGLKLGNKSADTGYPIIQLDESVLGRVIVRHENYMSLFDTNSERLKWLGTITNDYEIRGWIAELYSGNLQKLEAVIATDANFIRNKIGYN